MSGSAIKFDKRVAVLAYRLRKLAHLQEQDAERVARLLAESKVKSVKEAIVSHRRNSAANDSFASCLQRQITCKDTLVCRTLI